MRPCLIGRTFDVVVAVVVVVVAFAAVAAVAAEIVVEGLAGVVVETFQRTLHGPSVGNRECSGIYPGLLFLLVQPCWVGSKVIVGNAFPPQCLSV